MSLLQQAATLQRDFVFASRPEEVDVLRYAVENSPGDANARLHLGNLYANLGRMDEAVNCWQNAVGVNPKLAMAWRNLGLFHSAVKNDQAKAIECYRKAIAGRPGDQTLFRDLAEILIAQGRRPEAIELLKTMPLEGWWRMRRADATILLAGAYVDEKRYDEAIELLETTPYFVNWEGQELTWTLFHNSHLERGRKRMGTKNYRAALADFEAALTHPENIGVGRSDRPQEAAAEYWRGRALESLGKADAARSAWEAGAAGCEGGPEQNKYRKLCVTALAKSPRQ